MISSPEAFLRLIRGVRSERLCGCGRWLRWVSIALFQVLVVCQPADATIYYVRKTGNDSNSGVTAASAYLTVGKAMSVAAAGDTVYIGKGTYTEKLTTSRAGTASAKILFVADTKGVYTGDAAGSVVFQYSSGTALSVLHGNIEFSGMYVQGSTSGVTSLDVSGATTTGVAFRSGFIRYGTVNTVTVRNGADLLLDACTLTGATSRNNGPITVSGSSTLTAQLCTFGANYSGTMLNLTTTGAVVVDRCTFQSAKGWCIDSAGSTLHVKSCLLRTAASGGSGIRVQSGSAQIWNNTIASAGTTGFQITGGTAKFANNIVASCTNGLIKSGGTLTTANNLYWLNTTNYTGVAGGTGDILADPKFTNSASNWIPLSSSLAIDNGTNPSGMDPLDRNSATRPTGLLWDIGAYEKAGTSVTVPYSQTFESSTTAPAEWTQPLTTSTTGLTRFVGPFDNASLGLRLTTTAGTDYTLAFDVYLLGDWRGDKVPSTPDTFSVSINGASAFASTYAYPGSGYSWQWPDMPEQWSTVLYNGPHDAIFRRVVVDFTADSALTSVTFSGSNLQVLPTSGWGIDNVRVMTAATSASYRPAFEEAGRLDGFGATGASTSIGLLFGDLNNDGGIDALATGSAGGTALLNASGSFGPAGASVPTTVSGQTVLLDADNDGNLDVAFTDNTRANGVSLYSNSGGGVFALSSAMSGVSISSGAIALAGADLNGDGVIDLASFSGGGNCAILGQLVTSGTPATTVLSYSKSSTVFPDSAGDRATGGYCASGDINNDGFPDFFYNGLGGTFFVSNGDGTYARSSLGISPGLSGTERSGAVLADLNNDNVLELVLATSAGGTLQVWKRNSVTGTFSDATAAMGLSGISGVTGIDVGDFDNDGDQDLALTTASGGAVQLWLNSGAPGYTFTRDDLQGAATESAGGELAFVDVDLDGSLDLAVGSTSAAYPLRLFKNQGPFSAPGAATPDPAYLFVRVLGRGQNGVNKAGVGTRVELWDSANTTFLQRRELGAARSVGGQGSLWVHFGGIASTGTYTLRMINGSRQYSAKVTPASASTTIGGMTIPQMYTFDESTVPTIKVTRWREVSSDQ